jgi:nitroreductase
MPAAEAQATSASLPFPLIQEIAGAGTLAPSGDNLQPWRFRMDGECLLVIDDPRRDRSLFNVQNLASYIAIGALLENIIVVASRYNYRADISYFPNQAERDLIARVSFSPSANVDPLTDAIERRCTNRKPYQRRPLDVATFKKLDLDRVRFSNLRLIWLNDQTALKNIGAIVARADRLLFENPQIHDHLFSTIRWNAAAVAATRDGLPIETLELGVLGSKAFRMLKKWSVVKTLNRFGFSRLAARQSALLMRRCSAAGLITAPDIAPSNFVRAGQAFQRLWLGATNAGLALQPMTAVVFLQLKSILGDHQGLTADQVTSLESLRADLAKAYGVVAPQVPAMHFRIGYAHEPSAHTIRRPVAQILEASSN